MKTFYFKICCIFIDSSCLGLHVSCDMQRGVSIRWLSAEIQKSEIMMYDV